MKPKMQSWWKSSLVKAKNKGKTVGRPSKKELALSAVLSHMMKKNEAIMLKVISDQMFYGTGCFEVKANGMMKRKKLKNI